MDAVGLAELFVPVGVSIDDPVETIAMDDGDNDEDEPAESEDHERDEVGRRAE